MYRCIHCGSPTGETMQEAQECARKEHGIGVCVSDCRYCNEHVRHAAHTCANVRAGEPLPQYVAEFNAYWRR
jgi:hypothetical protein